MKRLTLCAAMVLAFGWGESPASAEQCLAQSTPPTYTAGMAVPQVCDTHGTQKVMTVDEDGNYVAGGGGGGGDASLAEQQTQTGLLTTIDADTGTIAGAVKAEDAAHTSGDTGVMALCVRAATATDRSASATDGDYEPCAVDANGRLHVTDGTIGVEDAAETAGGNLAMVGTVRRDTAASSAGSTGDNATLNTDASGYLWSRLSSAGATGAAPPTHGNYMAGLGSGATGGFLLGINVNDSFKAVSVTSATTTLLVTGVPGRHVRIGSLNLLSAIANNVALISGTGATCGTGTAAMAGGTTAANGWNFAANGGLTLGSGLGTVLQTVATGDSVCVITSSVGPLAGTIGYAIW